MTDHHAIDDTRTHPTRPDEGTSWTYFQRLEVAVRELLIEKRILTADEIRRQVEDMDSRTPARGAKVVARAWSNPHFRSRLLSDASVALEEMGMERGPYKLIVVENTPAVHNVIVCTLCSCYPRWLLGLPPDWYKSRNYRSRVVREPRAVLREFGLELPESTTVRVHDSTADMRYMVLPMQPSEARGWTEDQLAALVSRDTMVGVAVPTVSPPRQT